MVPGSNPGPHTPRKNIISNQPTKKIMTKREFLEAIQAWQQENREERFFLVLLGEADSERCGTMEGDMRGASRELVPAVAGMLRIKGEIRSVVSDAIGLMLKTQLDEIKKMDGTDKAENDTQEGDNLPW